MDTQSRKILNGLTEAQAENIRSVFAAHHKVQEVVLFGSRAKGNYKPGSDIDFALKGEALKLDDLLTLHNRLDALDLPYTFDLVIYATIANADVLDHIGRV